MHRWGATLAGLVATMTVVSGCAGGEPSAAQRAAGKAWVAEEGATWDTYATQIRDEMYRVFGPVYAEQEGGPNLIEYCAAARDRVQGAGVPDRPFPVAAVRAEMVLVNPILVLRRCAQGDLSQARMLAHRQVDRLATIDRQLEEYRVS